jgi:C4-dicarboxylate-binding protein DctP
MKSIIVGLVGALALVAPTFAQQPIVIKFSHVVAIDTPKGKAAEQFKKLAEERSKGRVKVEVYPNSILYKDKEEIEALQLGAVQMLAPSLSKFGPLGVKEFEAFDLPFIFDNEEDLHKVTDGPIGKMLFAKLESKGIHGLAYWNNGFKSMTANKPLHKVEDFRGQKFRIQSSKVLDAQIRSLGGLPQVMAFSEVYQAMQTGVVDGGENTISNIYTQKMHEVQKFLTLSNHGYIGYGVITNKKFWDGLPSDIRAVLDGAIRDATKYANEIARKENDDALESVRKSGRTQIITLSPQERGEWKKATLKAHQEMENRIGKELIEAIYKETDFDPKKL